MFDFGWPELLVVAIVLIVVVGPKDLPRVLRSFGRTTSKLKVMAGDFRKQFDEALREAELDEVKGLANEARKFDPRREVRKHVEPLNQAGRDIQSDLDGATKPAAKEAAAETAEKASPAAPAKTGSAAMPGENADASGSASADKPAAAKSPGKPAPRKKAPAKSAGAGKSTAKKKAPAESAGAGKSAAKRSAPKPAARKKKTTGTAP